jgi:hypothetical protein
MTGLVKNFAGEVRQEPAAVEAIGESVDMRPMPDLAGKALDIEEESNPEQVRMASSADLHKVHLHTASLLVSWDGGSLGRVDQVDSQQGEAFPFAGIADHTGLAARHSVPSDWREHQVQAGRHRRRQMSCCAHMEVSALHVHRHSRTAADAGQTYMADRQRIPRQSPRFRVIQTQDLGTDSPQDLGLVAVAEPGALSEIVKQCVVDVSVVGTLMQSQKDEYRRVFRLDMVGRRGRSRRDVLKSRSRCLCIAVNCVPLQQNPPHLIQLAVRGVQVDR